MRLGGGRRQGRHLAGEPPQSFVRHTTKPPFRSGSGNPVYTLSVTTAPLSRFSSVGLSTSRTVILRDINLMLHSGDVLGISGANGSGKTTLLRLLATLSRPTTGTWQILGLSADSSRQNVEVVRRQIALIGHTPAVWPELTLRENIDLIDALSTSPRAKDPLVSVGLENAADRRAGSASMGMLRRVEFARVLDRSPKLLLLDEAHAGLDASATELVDEVIRQVTDGGGAAVLVSHERSRLDDVMTRSAVLESGTLREDV